MTDEEKRALEKKNSGELEKALKDIKAELDGLKGEKAKLIADVERRDADLMSPQYLAYLEKGARGDRIEGDAKGKGEVDYEDLSKAQLVELLTSQRDGKLKDIDEAISKKLIGLEDKVGLAFAQLDIRLARKDNPDFEWDEHKNLFYDKAKENPKWNASRVIKDVRRDLRDVAETKATEDKVKEEEEHKALTEKSGGVVTDVTQGKVLSEGEAAEVGFKEAFGNKE